MLANVADDPTFIKRINIGDETWVYEYDVELPKNLANGAPK